MGFCPPQPRVVGGRAIISGEGGRLQTLSSSNLLGRRTLLSAPFSACRVGPRGPAVPTLLPVLRLLLLFVGAAAGLLCVSTPASRKVKLREGRESGKTRPECAAPSCRRDGILSVRSSRTLVHIHGGGEGAGAGRKGKSPKPKPKPIVYATEEITKQPGFWEKNANNSVVIMESRDDAHNVRNWHWTERDCSAWCKERLKHYLHDLVLANTTKCMMKISKLRKFRGDASVLNRRGRILAIWDIHITADWVGNLIFNERGVESGPVEQGTLEISMAHDEHNERPVIIFKARNNGAESVLEQGKVDRAEDTLREQLIKFLEDLKGGASPEKIS